MDVSGRGPFAAIEKGGGEFAAIARLASRLVRPELAEVWLGDDAAVLRGAGERLLITTDAVVAGVHFDPELVALADAGWKAMAVNVSDLAAMGGDPFAAVVAVAGPSSTDLDQLYLGLAEAASTWNCPIVGGDLDQADALVITVTALGRVDGGPGEPGPVTRAGARPGDALMVTGPLGASAAGLRLLRGGQTGGPLVLAHRRPLARLTEGQVARRAGVTAMIDVSDGLGADVSHVLDQSAVGARLSAVPVAAGATEEEALGGGEDYELVFSTPDPDAVMGAFAGAGLREPIVIGVCTGDAAERTLRGEPLARLGWEHRWR